MMLLLIFFPLLGFLTIFIGGHRFGNRGSSIVALFSICTSLLASIFSFLLVGFSHTTYNFLVYNWITVGVLEINWSFLFDPITSVMLIVVTFVSTLVHFYSLDYMKDDPYLSRFMSYLSLFTFFMLILVTSDNLIQLFFGWEGVGLCSYLLINFWHTRIQANKSAIKAMVVNRIGDFGLGLGICCIFYIFKSVEFPIIFALVPSINDSLISFCGFEFGVLNLIGFFIFVGAVGKSAQLGLHTWLPDAMEGPTPVSALIHAATMVTAGVFLIIRFSPLLEFAEEILIVISIFGGLTSFFAATVGAFQNDLKRVIAYSTCSQLGYMIFACGMSGYSLSFFHLSNHAFFKALLFLGAGSVIHALLDEQDMRRMGGLIKIMPVTYITMLIGSLSLMGFPFLTGFYSKDLILELAASNYYVSMKFIYWLGTISAFFTAFYSIRLIYYTFLGTHNGFLSTVKVAHESSFYVIFPLVLLSIASIFIGYFFKDIFSGLGSSFWGNSIFISPSHLSNVDAEFLPFYIKLIPVIFSLFGAFFSYFFYLFYYTKINQINFNFYTFFIYLYRFFNKKWYFDVIYNYFFVKKILNFGYYISFKLFDRGFIEYFGPFGLTSLINFYSSNIGSLQTGFIYHYVSFMLFGFLFFIMFFVSYFDYFFYFSFDFYFVFVFSLFFSLSSYYNVKQFSNLKS